MLHCDRIFRAGYCVTQNKDREIIEDAGIALSGHDIMDVGPWKIISAKWTGKEFRDFSHCIVMPGLVNAHCHAAMSVFRGLADDLELMDWLANHIWPVEKKLSPHVVYTGSKLSCAEMARSGTTTFSDMYLYQRQVCEAVDEVGLRGLLSEGVIQSPTLTYDSMDEGWTLIRKLHQDYVAHPRIQTPIMAHAVYTTTPEVLQESYRLAMEFGSKWMIHAAESESETALCLDKYGKRPIEHLDSLGLLGPQTVLFHCVTVSDREIERIAESGTSVVHCPESNMKLGNGCAPVQKLLNAGVCVALGTDGPASNNDLNMFREMASAALMQKGFTGDPKALPAQDVLDMATLNGAKAMGLEKVGRLEPGFKADIIALDVEAPHLMPMYSPVSHIVYAANGMEVCLCMVDGNIVYDHGAYPAFDKHELYAEICRVRQWILSNLKKSMKN
ncbi:MAG: amidohydrolase family protein [Desulfovibrio sp.]|uniref:amidohydrolase family protein n=1 Tax=Desulfovibrio sp. 7SRBS1 TaxID=3378064 RepID=UPI003B4100D3